MAILVAVASRHGSTLATGEHIAERLRESGCDARCQRIEDVRDLDSVTALIVGSGVYAGSWLPAVKKFHERFAAQLANIPVLAFSRGPVGPELKPAGRPDGADATAAAIGATTNMVFPGAIDRSGLNIAERGIVRLLKVPDGDYLDVSDVDRWVEQILPTLSR